MSDTPIRILLSGGDRRSIARSREARRMIEHQPQLVTQLVTLSADIDWLVSMRALDLLEKVARAHPQWVEPHKGVFIGKVSRSDKWEVLLQVVRALPLFTWNAAELPRVIAILRRHLEHPQKFVRAWAADSLSIFALQDLSLLPELIAAVTSFEASGSKALETRSRVIRARLRAAGVALNENAASGPSSVRSRTSTQ